MGKELCLGDSSVKYSSQSENKYVYFNFQLLYFEHSAAASTEDLLYLQKISFQELQ